MILSRSGSNYIIRLSISGREEDSSVNSVPEGIIDIDIHSQPRQ